MPAVALCQFLVTDTIFSYRRRHSEMARALAIGILWGAARQGADPPPPLCRLTVFALAGWLASQASNSSAGIAGA